MPGAPGAMNDSLNLFNSQTTADAYIVTERKCLRKTCGYTFLRKARRPAGACIMGCPAGIPFRALARLLRRRLYYGVPCGYTFLREAHPPRRGMCCGMPCGYMIFTQQKDPRTRRGTARHHWHNHGPQTGTGGQVSSPLSPDPP